jgi:hypothetical protein
MMAEEQVQHIQLEARQDPVVNHLIYPGGDFPKDSPIFQVQDGTNRSYDCGNCGHPIAIGASPGQFRGLFVQCPGCAYIISVTT